MLPRAEVVQDIWKQTKRYDHATTFRADENLLKLDCAEGHTDLYVYWKILKSTVIGGEISLNKAAKNLDRHIINI